MAIEMEQNTKEAFTDEPHRSLRLRNSLVFISIVAVWLIFDVVTKQYFDGTYAVGTVITDPIGGLFRFRLVHNTGAAWGLFGDSTTALGVMSGVVCVLLIGYFIAVSKRANIGEVLGLALVLAGGIGNGIDRFALGYVVDFIEFTFIQFPVFNIADIGVTCGFVIFLLAMFFAWSREDRRAADEAAATNSSAETPESLLEPIEVPESESK